MVEEKRLKRKVRNSYIVSTVSISLVLFMLGSVAYLLWQALGTAKDLRESVVVSVEVSDALDADSRTALAASLAKEELAAEVTFMSKEDKIEDEGFRKMFDEEFELLLENNPLLDSFEVRLAASSADKDLLDAFVARVEKMQGVEHVSYPAAVIGQLHKTVNRMVLLLLLFGGTLLAISLVLLGNTVKLAIYSRRTIINTMKLVGATKGFIMRPFIWDAFKQGVVAGIAASGLFAAAAYALTESMPELGMDDMVVPIAISVAMILSGIIIAVAFTATTVNKFVNMMSNKIYLY